MQPRHCRHSWNRVGARWKRGTRSAVEGFAAVRKQRLYKCLHAQRTENVRGRNSKQPMRAHYRKQPKQLASTIQCWRRRV